MGRRAWAVLATVAIVVGGSLSGPQPARAAGLTYIPMQPASYTSGAVWGWLFDWPGTSAKNPGGSIDIYAVRPSSCERMLWCIPLVVILPGRVVRLGYIQNNQAEVASVSPGQYLFLDGQCYYGDCQIRLYAIDGARRTLTQVYSTDSIPFKQGVCGVVVMYRGQPYTIAAKAPDVTGYRFSHLVAGYHTCH